MHCSSQMERDAALSHGAANFLKDRLLEQSDPFSVVVCRSCGLFAEAAPPEGLKRVRTGAWCRN